MPQSDEELPATKRLRHDNEPHNSTESVHEETATEIDVSGVEQQTQDSSGPLNGTAISSTMVAKSSSSSTVVKSTSSTIASQGTVTTPLASNRKLNFKKNPNFSYLENGSKKFVWKSLKQIIIQEEKLLPASSEGAGCECINYASLNAPPSTRPAKKYSDVSGLEAFYTDPQTKLHYHNAEEFRIIRSLASDIIQGYLALRGATNVVG